MYLKIRFGLEKATQLITDSLFINSLNNDIIFIVFWQVFLGSPRSCRSSNNEYRPSNTTNSKGQTARAAVPTSTTAILTATTAIPTATAVIPTATSAVASTGNQNL